MKDSVALGLSEGAFERWGFARVADARRGDLKVRRYRHPD